jgi:DNA (cytosine-5)-methyltransferase 1
MQRVCDLFSGTGGFSLGFQNNNNNNNTNTNTNTNIVFANDIAPESKLIYDANFNHKLTLKDLNTILPEEIPEHDILTAGFPCQPFSLAGQKEGFNDPRFNVFWQILHFFSFKMPIISTLKN